MFIPDPDLDFLLIPDPRSGSATLECFASGKFLPELRVFNIAESLLKETNQGEKIIAIEPNL